jgi:hypothetical protein
MPIIRPSAGRDVGDDAGLASARNDGDTAASVAALAAAAVFCRNSRRFICAAEWWLDMPAV